MPADNFGRSLHIEEEMLSPKVKIGLLVAAHVVGGLVLAWIVWPRISEFAIYGLLALTFADTGLVGIWGGLSATRFAWRLPAVLAGILYVWGVVQLWAVLDLNDLEAAVSLLLTIALTTVTIAVVLSRLRHGQRKLRLGHLEEALPMSEGIQFSIRHLLIATAIVAAVLGLGRVVRAFGKEWETLLVIGIFSPCFIMVELATLWAALGIGRPAPRLAIVIPTAVVVGAIPVFYLGVPSDAGREFYVWPVIVGLQAIITAASLIVRSCGWRLVSGGRVQDEQQVLPDDQGSGNAAASR